jgi:hypothetical protein
VGLLAREPVRVYLYGVIAAALALFVGLDVLDGATAALWQPFAAALLAVPAVEAARARVTPHRGDAA